jgi:hypothetical protein
MTKEALAKWITDNQKDVIPYVHEEPLSDEKIREYEHKSAMASGAIDVLKELEKSIKEILKKGTDSEIVDGELRYLPQTITIPPTKGYDALEANRKFANDKLRDGVDKTEILYYLIPFPEDNSMVAVDIEGRENTEFTRFMTDVEAQKYSLPIVQESKRKKKSRTMEIAEDQEEEDELFH